MIVAPVDAMDDDLVAQFRAGERRAFDEIVRRHKNGLFNFARTMVRSPSIAEDIVRATFVRVVAPLDDFAGGARFATGLYAIARRLCLDHLRLAESPDDAGGGNGPGDDADHGTASAGERTADPSASANADRDAPSHELRLRMAAAVDALPDDQREVFGMRELADIPFERIAEITETPENAVKSRMRGALQRLQAALHDFEEHARKLP